jgi:Tol biopolymer transport system component
VNHCYKYLMGVLVCLVVCAGCGNVESTGIEPMTTKTPAKSTAPVISPTVKQVAESVASATPTGLPSPTVENKPSATPIAPLDGSGGGVIAFDLYHGGTREIYVMNADESGVRQLTFDHADDYDPDWSPDGIQLAFVSDRTGSPNIYILNVEQALQDPRQAEILQLTDNAFENQKPAWSPDGTRLVFESNRDGNWEIYIVEVDSGEQTRVTDNSKGDNNPAWSPDGKLIGFSSFRDGNWEVYTMQVDGSDPRRLTYNENNDYEPVWSPDGSQIAFESHIDQGVEICVMDVDGENKHQLTYNGAVTYDPVWSPDGGRILYSIHNRGDNPGLYWMNSDGSGQEYLLAGAGSYTHDWGDFGAGQAVPSVTSTPAPLSGSGGGVIAFASNRDTSTLEIYAMNADGSDIRRLTKNFGDDIAPSWSPDGKKIAFMGMAGDHWDIYVLDYKAAIISNQTNEPVNLTGSDTDEYYPSWSPDGSQIVFTREREGSFDIWVMDTEGQNECLLVSDTGRADAVGWSPDGTRIAFSIKDGDDREIFVQDVLCSEWGGKAEMSQLTDNETNDYAPSWSPDGTQLAYYALQDSDYDIFMMNADGSGSCQLTQTDGNDWWPGWSPDGTSIVFSAMQDTKYLHDIFIVSADGTNRRQLTSDTADNWWAAWQPNTPSSP